ncbi:hypothetical protein HGA64_05455, partial [Candidatus Falkowbacteria bacterium]|nr:hypothetical protein [Candidatus Falkowbacteria bacterium]
ADQFQQTSSSTNPAVPSIKNPLSLIRPGMTANVTITTEVKDNALAVPSRAILSNAAGNKIVRLLQNNQSVEVPVVLGLRADEGLTEIVSGIKAGDRIITAIKNGSN